MKYKLREQEEDSEETTSTEEPTSQAGGGGAGEKINYNIMLIPDDASVSDVLAAFENKKNYGIYLSNLRNTNVKLKDAMIDYFGPSVPTQKINALKKRGGKPFPPKTKQAVDKFIEDFTNKASSKTNVLSYEIGPGGSLVFPFNKNPAKDLTKKIIKTVMDTAGFKYELKDIEAMDESIKSKVQKLIKEKLAQKQMNENESSFNITPNIAFKIHKALKEKYPQIGQDFTESAFFTFLNNNIKENISSNSNIEEKAFEAGASYVYTEGYYDLEDVKLAAKNYIKNK